MMDQHSPYPVVWVPPSKPLQGCPPGLENLIPLDYLLVQQQTELLEILTDYESENKYYVKDRWGQILFFAHEQSGFCARNCFPLCRPFTMDFNDITRRVVIHLDQPFALFCKKVIVEAPREHLIASVEQTCSFSKPTFEVKDQTGQSMFLIEGPPGYVLCGGCCCRKNVPFKVLSMDGVTEVGAISKVWTGLGQEMFTDADNFTINFASDLDVRLKAALLGACILIDMVYFERTSNN